MRTVILGIGNIILSDEGVGVRALELLAERYRLPAGVEVIDGGTAGMELFQPLSGADLLLVLDAVKSGKPPGTVVTLKDAQVPAFFRSRLSPHEVSLSDVLASLELSGLAPGALVLIGVEPASLEIGLELTPQVAARLPDVVARAVAELAARGIALEEMAPCA